MCLYSREINLSCKHPECSLIRTIALNNAQIINQAAMLNPEPEVQPPQKQVLSRPEIVEQKSESIGIIDYMNNQIINNRQLAQEQKIKMLADLVRRTTNSMTELLDNQRRLMEMLNAKSEVKLQHIKIDENS